MEKQLITDIEKTKLKLFKKAGASRLK